MATHLEKGKTGEQIALRFLIENDFLILHQNWRYKRLEVDIIAQKDHCLIFIEVKTRSGLGFGMPENFVDTRKQQLLVEAAGAYIEAFSYTGDIRFDIIGVYIPKNGTPQIEHFPDAFWDYGT